MFRSSVRKFFRTLYKVAVTYFIVLTVIIGVLFFAPELWSPTLRQRLETQVLQRTGTEIVIEKLRLGSLWPITFRLDNVRIKPHPSGLSGQISAMDLSVWAESIDGNPLRPRIVFAAQIYRPNLELLHLPSEPSTAKEKAAAVPETTEAPQWLHKRPVGLDVGFRVSVENGEVVFKDYSVPLQLSDFAVDLKLPSTLQAWWKPTLTFKGKVQTTMGKSKLNLPVDLNISDSSLNPQSFNFDKVILNVAGMVLNGKGQHLWKDGLDTFQFNILESDLSQVPPEFLPTGKWHGKFTGGFTYRRKSGEVAEWRGNLQSEAVKGELDLSQGDGRIKGEVALKTSLKFQYKDQLTLDDGSVAVDLTAADVRYSPWFVKPPGVEMVLDVVADSRDEQFWLRRTLLRLAQLRLEATGKFNLKPNTPGQVDVVIPMTSVRDLEKYFPPFSKISAGGQVSAYLRVTGPMQVPQKLMMDLKNLELRRIYTHVKYENAEMKLDGPLAADLKITGLRNGENVVKADISGQADLSAMKIEYSDKFKKPSPWRLLLNGQVTKLGTVWSLNELRIASQGGAFSLNGQIQPGTTVGINLKSQLDGLNLTAWSELVKVPDYKFGGTLEGKASLAGKYYAEEPLGNSPLVVNGDFVVKDGVFKSLTPPKTEPAVQPTATATEKPPPSAWLPPWPIYRQAFLKLQGNFLEVQYQHFKAEGVQFEGIFGSGRWKGTSQVANLWGGKVDVTKFILSPLAEPTTMEVQGTWMGIEAAQLLPWFNPKLKGYMTGKMSGKINAIGTVPNPVDGYRQLRADGAMQLSQAQFSTFQIDEKINEAIEKLKLRTNTVKSAPVNFQAQTSYDLTEGNVSLSGFLLSTEKRDELRLRGIVREDLNVDLTGTVTIGSVKIGGAVASANADKTGRMVVPIQIKGDIRKPDFSISGSTLKTMLTKTVEKEVKDIGEKVKKDLGNDLKKKLKNIFGK